MTQQPKSFADKASQARRSMPREILGFLAHHKKWWLAPLILVLLMIALLAAMATPAVAPFIYSLF